MGVRSGLLKALAQTIGASMRLDDSTKLGKAEYLSRGNLTGSGAVSHSGTLAFTLGVGELPRPAPASAVAPAGLSYSTYLSASTKYPDFRAVAYVGASLTEFEPMGRGKLPQVGGGRRQVITGVSKGPRVRLRKLFDTLVFLFWG